MNLRLLSLYGLSALTFAMVAQAQVPPTTANLLPPTAPGVVAAPMPAAPAVPGSALPAVAPTPAMPVTVPAISNVVPSSMGDSRLSLLFTPNQINAMRDALAAAESKRSDVGPAADLAVVMPVEKPKATEPETYPVFYLSSIVYHSPADWSIWVSGRKITSSKNPTTLKVLSVSPDRAVFAWNPEYAEAINNRRKAKLFAPTDEMKNKLTTPPSYHYDEKTGTVTFSLLINQSFVGGYFTTFEGFLPSPKLAPLPVENTAGATAGQLQNVPVTGAAPAPLPPPVPETELVRKPNEGLADSSINALLKQIKK